MFKKNTAVSGFPIGHFIQAADGVAKTTGTPTCKRLLDGTGGTLTNAAAYDATAGVWKIDLAAGDMNGDMVGLVFALADCIPISYAIRTSTSLVSDVETDIADIQTQIGTAGAGLTALPWNAAWDAEVQSEATDALNAYDPPTNAEMEARTLPAANYFDPAADTVVNVTTVAALAANSVNASALATDAVTEIVDGLLKRDMSAVTGESARSPLNALRQLRNKVAIDTGVLTVYKEDDTTAAWTADVVGTTGADPVTSVDPT